VPIIILLLTAAYFAIPSVDHLYFSGLPFATIPEYFYFLALLPIIAWQPIRERWYELFTRHLKPQTVLIVALLGAGILGKALLFTSGDSQGFVACYRAIDEQPISGNCESSYSNAFRQINGTRIDTHLDFEAQDWNLSFVNDIRFNYYHWVPGTIPRERIPFSVSWRGLLEYDGDRNLEIEYVGQARVRIGPNDLSLGPAYESPQTIRLQLPKGLHSLLITYTFNDGSRRGMESDLGPLPIFRLTTETPQGSRPVESANISVAQHVASWLVDAIGFGSLLLLLMFYLKSLSKPLLFALCTGAGITLIYLQTTEWAFISLDTAFLLSLIVPIIAVLLGQTHLRNLLFAYVSVALLVFIHESISMSSLGAVLIRDGGSDYLAYESFARSILDTWSLEAGEAVFYYQPFFRYLLFLEHLVLGDGDVLITACARTLLTTAILGMIWRFRTPNRLNTIVSSLVLTFLLILFNSPSLLNLLRQGISEYPTWIMFPVAFSMLTKHTGQHHTSSATLIGFAIVTRINQFPGWLWLYAIRSLTLLSSNKRSFLIGTASLVTICLIPVTHNLWYGNQVVFTTTSASIPQNLILQPTDYINAFDNDTLRQSVTYQLDRLFYGPTSNERVPLAGGGLALIFHGLQLLWVLTIFMAVASLVTKRPVSGLQFGFYSHRSQETFQNLAIALLPGVFLAPHLFYQVDVSYPRHIILAHLAMAAVSLHATSGSSPEPSKTTSNSVIQR